MGRGLLVCAVLAGSAMAASTADLQSLWARFYESETLNDGAAESALRQILAIQPQDTQALKSMLYLKIRTGQPAEAIRFADQVLLGAPDDESVRMQRAYLLNQLARNAEAHAEFSHLTKATDSRIAAAACQAAENLRFAVTPRYFSPPYFADAYIAPSYESRSEAAILPLKLRAGRYYGAQQRGQLYGFATLNRDSKSTGGVRPEIVDENALILGAGVNYRFGSDFPVTAYLEVGASQDLIDRNRARNRASLVAGLTSYRQWGDAAPYCGQSVSFPASFHADFYGNIAVHSRNGYNVILDLRLRPGLNLVKSASGTGRAYLKLRSSHDSDGEFYNNILEIGPGISFDFAPNLPLSLRLESVKVFYLRERAANGRSSYRNHRLELTYYRSF